MSTKHAVYESRFFIKAAHIPACLEAVNLALSGSEHLKQSLPFCNLGDAAMWAGGLLLMPNQQGDVINFKLADDYLGSHFEDTLYALAPYIEKGSIITMMNDNQALWQYVFDGEECTIRSLPPFFVFPELAEEFESVHELLDGAGVPRQLGQGKMKLTILERVKRLLDKENPNGDRTS